MNRAPSATRRPGPAVLPAALTAVLFTGLLASTSGLVGCETPPPNVAPVAGLPDPVPDPYNNPQVMLMDPDLQSLLAFPPAVVFNDPGRVMEVEQPVRNFTTETLLVDYRIVFYDDRGREVSPVMDWEFAPIRSKQMRRLKANALDDTAEDFRVEVKWAQ
ncbi:MAG: DUF1425 domain-containing protein [Planctomycetes bacterium]|nr:DUF1425 domain-containing protein [Planctomycetota bacterium]